MVRVLEEDPDLGAGLDDARAEAARRLTVAPVEVLEVGTWHPRYTTEEDDELLRLLVLGGLLARTVRIAETTFTELVGPEDILRPWQAEAIDSPFAHVVEWSVHAPTRLAVLDRRFAAVAGRSPELMVAIVARLMRRTRSLVLHIATSHISRVDVRILVILWHFADRWGRVRREGVFVPVALTHEMLANVVGARRPSVTSALSRLRSRRLVSQRRDGWLLFGEPPQDLRRLQAAVMD